MAPCLGLEFAFAQAVAAEAAQGVVPGANEQWRRPGGVVSGRQGRGRARVDIARGAVPSAANDAPGIGAVPLRLNAAAAEAMAQMSLAAGGDPKPAPRRWSQRGGARHRGSVEIGAAAWSSKVTGNGALARMRRLHAGEGVTTF